MKTWQELLARLPKYEGKEYGPCGAAVESANWAVKETLWFAHVAEPLEDSRVVVAASWGEALTIFDDDEGARYNVNGHLITAHEACTRVFEQHPELEPWWQAAQDRVRRIAAYSGSVPKHLPRERRELVFEYVYEFLSMLYAEIIASPYGVSDYFRQQLAWFHAGRMPCGWEGEWPVGKMRVL